MKAEAASVGERRSMSSTASMVLAVIGTVAVWALSPVSLATIVLLVMALLFIFAFRRPVWAIATLLVSQLTIPSYMIETPLGITLSLRLLLLLLTVVILWRMRSRTELGPRAKYVIIPTLILMGWSVVGNLVNTGFDFAFKDFRIMLLGLLTIVFVPALTKDEKDLKLLSAVALVVLTASAAIGVMQHYNFTGLGSLAGSTSQAGWELRVSGLAEGTLELAFALPLAILTIVGVSVLRGIRSSPFLIGLVLVLMVGALYFTYTRSSLLALVLGAIALVMFLKTRINAGAILLVIVLLVGFASITGLLEGKYLGGRTVTQQDESYVSRQIVWQAGIAMAMDKPVFGIGAGQFKKLSPQYASSVDPALLSLEDQLYWSYHSLGNIEPHNDFLMIWVSYGLPALLAYVWLLVAVLRNLVFSYRQSTTRFMRGLSVGLAAAVVAYGANAFYHNFFSTVPLFWILAGLSVAVAGLARSNRDQVAVASAEVNK